MNPTVSRALFVMTVLFTFSHLFSCCISENHSQSFQLLDSPNGSFYYNMNIAVSQSLYEYYREKNHTPGSNDDFAKFVTPYALQTIADSLWDIYTDDEDFANGVLMIVHQIPYEETLPLKYPVETIVENKGDCDLFSYIASSIMKAGGLEVVLLYYENDAHMNVGVHLSHTPHDVRGLTYYVTHNHIQYYVAECTGDSWKNGWRVGERPDDLQNASLEVITLENCEQWAPGQISASYKTLEPSTISLMISPTFATQGDIITLSGQLSPPLQGKTVAVYIKTNNLPWTVLDTVITDSNGGFTYAWGTRVAGVHYIRASWSGNTDYVGADSPTRHVIVLSVFFILLLAITVILICVGTVVFLTSRLGQREAVEPQSPGTAP